MACTAIVGGVWPAKGWITALIWCSERESDLAMGYAVCLLLQTSHLCNCPCCGRVHKGNCNGMCVQACIYACYIACACSVDGRRQARIRMLARDMATL